MMISCRDNRAGQSALTFSAWSPQPEALLYLRVARQEVAVGPQVRFRPGFAPGLYLLLIALQNVTHTG